MVGAQVWLDQNYPVNGTCQRKDDKENYGKKLEEIINLDISSQGLEGELILYSIDHVNARFPNLRTLNISYNSLSKVTWPTDGQINQDYLEEIDWSHNQFAGDDPRNSIRSFPKLRIANISYNSIVTNFSVFDNEYLTRLDCSNNHLISIALKNNSNLQELDCSNNPIVSLSFDVNAFSNLKLFNCLGMNFNSSPSSPSLTPSPVNDPSLFNKFVPVGIAGGAVFGAVVAGGAIYIYKNKKFPNLFFIKHLIKRRKSEDEVRLNSLSQSNASNNAFENASSGQSILDEEDQFQKQAGNERNENLVSNNLPQSQADNKNNWRISLTNEKPVLKLLIGRGGYGEVYYGKWGLQDVAIKKILFNNISQNKVKEITNEIDILKNLRNRYIIQYYGVYFDNQELLIIMDYAENGTLNKFINDNKDKEHDWNFNNKLIKQITLGLAYIHHNKITHRDLKSMNILLTNNYQQVKISDFGLSKIKNINSSQTKDMKGTLGWMAPEILKNRAYSEQSDIYALGMIIWEIAAKCTTPFKDIDNIWVYVAVNNGRENIPSNTPQNIQDIIQQCWKENPNERITLEKILKTIGVDESELQTINNDDKLLEYKSRQDDLTLGGFDVLEDPREESSFQAQQEVPLNLKK